jgi:hypothetical protein
MFVLVFEIVNMQVLGPAAEDGLGLIVLQLEDHPPNWAPVAGAVNMTVVPTG